MLPSLKNVVSTISLAIVVSSAFAAGPQTPPMGFSSWNFGGGSFPRESNAISVADAMVSRGLRDSGYVYLMAFDGWWWTFEGGKRAADGSAQPDPDRWPHGVKYVCDYIHSKGLKVAGYSDIGAQGYGDGSGRQWGAYPYYQKDADQFAAWGWDYIKIDDCFAGGGQSKEKAYAEFCGALRNNASKRPIFLSLSTPSTHTSMDFGPRVANMWRSSNDINSPGWMSFTRSAHLNFDSSEEFWWNQAPGIWNDIDMMVIGVKGSTDVENKSLLNMWAVRGAPLLIGCDVRNVPQSVIDVLTNKEAIAVDQDPLCAQGRKVREDLPNVQVYSKPLGSFTGGDRAVLLLNRSKTPRDITFYWTDLGLSDGKVKVRDLNAHKDLGHSAHSYTAKSVQPEDSVLLKVTGGRFDWSVAREYEAESAYNTKAGTVRHHAYRDGFSSYACVDGIGRGRAHYLQFNKVVAPEDGTYPVDIYYASGGDTRLVNDSHVAITYGPGWQAWKESGYVDEDTHYATAAGSYCVYRFTGNGVSWFCKTCYNRGMADVYVDGTKVATVDCYGTSGAFTEVFKKSSLSYGEHSLRIVLSEQKNPKSSGTMVDVDALKVTIDSNRPMKGSMSVNGGSAQTVEFPGTGGDDVTGRIRVNVNLRKGENTIRFFDDDAKLPTLDKIVFPGAADAGEQSVRFVKVDSTTGGSWSGKYGSFGYSVFGAPASIPAGVRLRFKHGGWDYYFSQGSDDRGLPEISLDAGMAANALQMPGKAGERALAAISRSNSFTVDVEVAGKTPRQVAFYMLDPDGGRSARVEAFDGATNALKDVRPVSSYSDGRYLVYTVAGKAKFRFTSTAGPGVLLSGVFLD